MKTNDLLRHLRRQGCQFVAHGRNHDTWQNPANGNVARICRQLDVPKPAGR